MKVVSKKPKGQKMFKSVKFILEDGHSKGMKVKRPLCIYPIGKGWWFCLERGEWEPKYNGVGDMTSTYYSMKYHGYHNVYSLKAAKRLIAKWDIPKGTKFKVGLPFIGFDFIVTKS